MDVYLHLYKEVILRMLEKKPHHCLFGEQILNKYIATKSSYLDFYGGYHLLRCQLFLLSLNELTRLMNTLKV